MKKKLFLVSLFSLLLVGCGTGEESQTSLPSLAPSVPEIIESEHPSEPESVKPSEVPSVEPPSIEVPSVESESPSIDNSEHEIEFPPLP